MKTGLAAQAPRLKGKALAACGEAEPVKRVAEFYNSALASLATFLGNHDILAGRRVWDQLEGDVARYKLAAASA